MQYFHLIKVCFFLGLFIIINLPVSAYFPSPENWRDHIFYMVMLDRFDDGDPSNNHLGGIYNPTSSTGIHGGDLRGVTRRLDYLKNLGITAIWISPVAKNDGDYHGYAAVDFKQVDPRLGTMEDLRELVAQAHERGIYVFLDIVTNHMGHWIRSSNNQTAWNYPTGYSLVWRNINNRYAPAPFDDLNSFHNYGHVQNWNDPLQSELGWIFGLNDIKTSQPNIRQALIDIYKWWLEQTNCDGFRVDTVKHVDLLFWQYFCQAIRDHAALLGKNNFLLFGEVWDNDYNSGLYTGTQAGGPYVFESVKHYTMYYTITDVFALDQNTKLIDDRYAQLFHYDSTTHDYLVTFIDNHDNPRFLYTNRANNDLAKIRLALGFLLTSRGIPVIYYGTEQGFNGGIDPHNRENMFDGQFEFGPSLGDNFNQSHPLFIYISRLNEIRKRYIPLRRGTQIPRWNNSVGPGIYAFSRIYNNNEIVVILNTSNSIQSTRTGSTGLITNFPQHTVLYNLLNESETITVGTGGIGANQINAVLPARSMQILSSYILSTSAPMIRSTSPKNRDNNISLNKNIYILFNKAVDKYSAQSAFSISPPLSGSFIWKGLNMIFQPDSALLANQIYTVHINTTVYSPEISGPNFMESEHSFFFTTRLKDDFEPPVIADIQPMHNSILTNTLRPLIGAQLSDIGSGINPSTIIITLNNNTVQHHYSALSGWVSYQPIYSLVPGIYRLTIEVEDHCGNKSIQGIAEFEISNITKIMDGNFTDGEWDLSEKRISNNINPWVTSYIQDLYLAWDADYLYIGVTGTVDLAGYANVIGVYVDFPTITTGINQIDYFHGIQSYPIWDPDFMYAVVRMENDPNGGGSVRRINPNGTTTQIGNLASGDCGALSPLLNENQIGGIEFRIPWAITNGAGPNTNIKIGAWLGWANSAINPAAGLGGGSLDELGPDTNNTPLINENPFIKIPNDISGIIFADGKLSIAETINPHIHINDTLADFQLWGNDNIINHFYVNIASDLSGIIFSVTARANNNNALLIYLATETAGVPVLPQAIDFSGLRNWSGMWPRNITVNTTQTNGQGINFYAATLNTAPGGDSSILGTGAIAFRRITSSTTDIDAAGSGVIMSASDGSGEPAEWYIPFSVLFPGIGAPGVVPDNARIGFAAFILGGNNWSGGDAIWGNLGSPNLPHNWPVGSAGAGNGLAHAARINNFQWLNLDPEGDGIPVPVELSIFIAE